MAQPVRLSPPSAVVPSETMRSPSRRGLAPAQSGTVSRWVENSSRGPGRVPGSSTIRLPVSVGTGMRVLRFVEADRGGRHAGRLQRVGNGRRDLGLLSGDALDRKKPHQVIFRGGDIEGNRSAAHRLIPLLAVALLRQGLAALASAHRPQGSPSICQTAKRAVQRMKIHTT